MHPETVKKKISSELHCHVIGNQKSTVDNVIAATGFSGSHIYSILEGERSISMYRFPQIYRGANKPVAALKAFVACCDPDLAIVSLVDTGDIDGSMTDELEDINIQIGHFIEDKRKALADGKLDDEERMELIDDALDMISTMNRLIEEVKHHGEKPETGVKSYKNANHVMSMEK